MKMRPEQFRSMVWKESKVRNLGPIGNLFMDVLKRERPDLYEKALGTEFDSSGQFTWHKLMDFLDKNL